MKPARARIRQNRPRHRGGRLVKPPPTAGNRFRFRCGKTRRDAKAQARRHHHAQATPPHPAAAARLEDSFM